MTIKWAASHKKVPNGLSCCHTKRRTGHACPSCCHTKRRTGHARPSFGMTMTLIDWFFFLSWCHTKRRVGAVVCTHPSFGMTTTQDIRELFAYCSPNMSVWIKISQSYNKHSQIKLLLSFFINFYLLLTSNAFQTEPWRVLMFYQIRSIIYQ